MSDERSEIEAELSFLYGEGDSDEKTWRRSSILSEDGEISKFHRNALRQAVQTKQDEAESPPAPAAPPVLPPELAQDIPEPVEGYDDRPDVARMIKAACRIITAVANWGKPQPDLKIGNRTEGIHVRCPFSSHEDINPSAWINTSTDLWTCGKCQEGGDQIGFYAARKYDYTQHDLRNKDVFPQVIREMAEELGIDPDPPVAVPPPDPDPEPDDVVVAEPQIPAAPDNLPPSEPPDPDLVAIDPDPDFDPLDTTAVPTYDWRNLDIPRGTFLSDWLEHTTKNNPDTFPEYFIMLGFQALGLACGHHLQQLTPHKGLTNASLMLVLIGASGANKTRARKCLTDLLGKGRGSRFNDDTGEGVLTFPSPGSPEALLEEFRFQNQATLEMAPITGLMMDDEFATLISKARRKGGEHFKQRLMALSDFYKEDVDPEVVLKDRSLGSGVRIAYDSYFAMLSTTQTDTVRTQIEDVDMVSGFMNRIIPVFGAPRRPDDTTFIRDNKRPPYMDTWDYTWDWIRGYPVRTEVQWAPDVGSYLMKHPYWLQLGVYEQTEGLSILSRLKHTACKLAFLLAVNEGNKAGGPLVECKHFEIVLRFMKDYLHKCYGYFVTAAKSTDTKDIKLKILEYCHGYYDRHHEWPARFLLGKQRFWRNASEQTASIALDNLITNEQISEVQEQSPKGVRKILIATDIEGPWRRFALMHGRKIDRDQIYAGT